MKPLLALLLVALLTACPVNLPVDIVVPNEAGRFAKMTFKAGVNKTFDAVRESLERGTGDFLVIGLLKNRDGVATFWQKIAGQSARIFFKLEPSSDGSTTVVRVFSVPAIAPEPQLLARSLDLVGLEAADTLQLNVRSQEYKLEPDR